MREVLAAVEPRVEVLTLRASGAQLAVAHAWLRVCAEGEEQAVGGTGAPRAAAFPRLQELLLQLDGRGSASEAHSTHVATQVLDSLPRCPALEAVSISLRGVKLPWLPPSLQDLPALRHLCLAYDPGLLCPLLPAQHGGALPLLPGLRTLTLACPPLQPHDVLEAVAARLPSLQSFAMVTLTPSRSLPAAATVDAGPV